MPFSENQLSTWANQGATATSASTYESIKKCIENHNWNDDVHFNIYLQGSYRNFTNIRGDSDVDVVVEFTSVFYSNKLELPPNQLDEFNDSYSDGKYTLSDIKKAIITRLESHYGKNYVDVGNKSIKVLANSGRLDCDVVCCAEYREYRGFSSQNTGDYVKGIVFWTTHTNEKVINFPKLHYDNGVNKNSDCSSNYKPTVRIVKNMKSRITKSIAPSYFIECLMYNILYSNYIRATYSDTIVSILNSLNNFQDAELKKLICQNEQRYLFGASDQQWDLNNCKTFISQLIEFWNNG
jgi:hypothetical protein